MLKKGNHKKIIIILRVKLEFFSALYNDHVQRIFKSLPRGIKVKKEYDKLIFLDIIIIQKIHIVFVLVISHIAGDGRPRWKAMSADTFKATRTKFLRSSTSAAVQSRSYCRL